MDATNTNTETTMQTNTKPCAECGSPMQIGDFDPRYPCCLACKRVHAQKFRETHPHLYAPRR